MSSSFLSVDLGNTRCKLCVWSIAADGSAALVTRADFASADTLPREVADWLGAQPRIERAALCAVAPPALEEALAAALDAVFGARFERRPATGLIIECREPDKVGRDRLFAARGALERIGRSALVVDAGTALTVDALRVDGDASGHFLGGAIAPGPALLARALAHGGARLFAVDPQPDAHALGRDTREALQAGIVIGFRGAARELCESVAREARLANASVLLTGGARRFLSTPGVFGTRTVIEDGELVHHGLRAACSPGLGRVERVP